MKLMPRFALLAGEGTHPLTARRRSVTPTGPVRASMQPVVSIILIERLQYLRPKSPPPHEPAAKV